MRSYTRTVLHADGSRSTVLHEVGWRRFQAFSRGGALSVKCMFGGAATYATGRARHRVDDGGYLVLNEGSPYGISIDAARPLESFCVFLAPELVSAAQRARSESTERLLDEPVPQSRAGTPGFVERVRPHDELLSPVLQRLRGALASGDTDAARLEEHLHDVAAGLLDVGDRTRREIDALDAVRPSTRAELYRRLHRARDLVEACLAEPLPLERLAGVAGMAPHHFLRVHRRAFGLTPHQHVTARRIERAKRLLEQTKLPVTRVCLEVGFASLGSFSALFRRRTGSSPSAWRGVQKSRIGEAGG